MSHFLCKKFFEFGAVRHGKEESPAPMFNDLIKHDLPEIDEAKGAEEVQEEEKSIVTQIKDDVTSNDFHGFKQTCLAEDIGRDKGKPCDLYLNKNVTRPQTGLKDVAKVNCRKNFINKPIVKRRTDDVLEFMEEAKIKKKLTKSQERGLLDRLQGFSTKCLNSNR